MAREFPITRRGITKREFLTCFRQPVAEKSVRLDSPMFLCQFFSCAMVKQPFLEFNRTRRSDGEIVVKQRLTPGINSSPADQKTCSEWTSCENDCTLMNGNGNGNESEGSPALVEELRFSYALLDHSYYADQPIRFQEQTRRHCAFITHLFRRDAASFI